MRRPTRYQPRRGNQSTLVRGRWDTLTGGVSQQPEHLRLEGQGEEQINGWSSPVEGLSKRRPTVFDAKLLATEQTDIWAGTMLARDGERYLLMAWEDSGTGYLQITRDGASVDINVHGTGLGTTTVNGRTTITFTNTSYGYVASNLLEGYSLVNQGALGLLANRTKTVAMDSATTPATVNEALVFIQGVVFDVTYTVTLDEGEATELIATFDTPLATDSPNKLSTTDTAADLQTTIDTDADWVAVQIGPVVHIRRSDNSDFTIKVDDDRSNTLARAIKGEVENFSDLPVQAKGEMVIKVESDPTREEDDYWVEFVRADGATDSFGRGSWQECPAPGIEFQLDEDTMPLVIYREAQDILFVGPADGSAQSQTVDAVLYEYTFPTWGERTAGNLETVPNPSFVGKAIKDHLIFRGRYVVTAGENVICSQTDDIFAFFADTSLQVLETDPIDVRASSESSVDLQWLVPVGTTVLPTSAREQFLLRASDQEVLTPRSAVIDLLGKVEVESQVRPRVVGPTVVFATANAGDTQFREMQVTNSNLAALGLSLGAGQDLTLNVPKYIQGAVTWWDNGENLDYMVVMTDDDPKTIYVYKYLWQSASGQIQRNQSGWSKWTFEGDVRWAKFYDNRLHLIQSYADGTFLVGLTAEELDDLTDPGMYLDRQITFPACNSDALTDNDITASYDLPTDTTTFTLPYTMRTTTDAVVSYTDGDAPGVLIGSASSGTQIVCDVKGDFTAKTVVFGARYSFEYQCTRAYLPQGDQERQRTVGVLDGRLQVSNWSVHFSRTGEFNVHVSRDGRGTDSVHTMTAIEPGVGQNQIGQSGPVLDTGVFRVAVRSKNDQCRVTVESDSHLPVRLNGYSWEGNYNDRARRL